MSQPDKIKAYIDSLPQERQEPMRRIRQAISSNIPAGFIEVMGNSPAYIVPLSVFPAGYHCRSDTPLPFLSFASQKNFIALYHFGMYVDQKLMQWFVGEYPKHVNSKPDMGKSCIRFKKMDQIPYALIAELAGKRTLKQWVACYEKALQR